MRRYLFRLDDWLATSNHPVCGLRRLGETVTERRDAEDAGRCPDSSPSSSFWPWAAGPCPPYPCPHFHERAHGPGNDASGNDLPQRAGNGRHEEDEADHLMRKELGGQRVDKQPRHSVAKADERDDKDGGRKVAQGVEVLPVSLLVGGLMLSHAVHDGIPGLGVRDKETTHAGGDGFKIGLEHGQGRNQGQWQRGRRCLPGHGASRPRSG